MVGTGLGAKRGILFKNAIALEQSASLDTVVLDKTGTLTRGEPEVVEIIGDGLDDGELLRLVAAVERETEHPLAEAIVHAAEQRGVERPRAERRSKPSPATAPSRPSTAGAVIVGNRRLLEREQVSLDGLARPSRRDGGRGRPSSTSPSTAARPA